MGSQESSSMSLPILLLLTIVISYLFFCCIGVTAETNTLNQSDNLNFTQQLVSNNKNFTLGFVKPFVDYDNNNTYLAIWNSKYESPSSPVWIANRDTPITNASFATLFIHQTGKFVINRTRDGHPIQLCPGGETNNNNNVNYNNIKAVLLDNGNLVLTEVNSNGSVDRTLWQSFDCPTDTLLPGMKLGINHRTGRNWTLTSFLAPDDPSQGAFTLEWNPNSQELVVRRRGMSFWNSGILKNVSDDLGRMTFENLEVMESTLEYKYYRMRSNKSLDEEVFSYSLKYDPMDPSTYKSIKMRIDYTGAFSFAQNGLALSLEDLCYGYSTENGCAKWSQPKCRTDENTRFVLRSGGFANRPNSVGDGGHYDKNGTIGLADCRVRCWNDCDCQAYSKTVTVGCLTISKDTEFIPDPSGQAVRFYVIQRPQNERKTKKWIAISVSVCGVLLVSVTVIIFYWRWRRKVRKERRLLQLITSTDTIHNANELENDKDFAQNLKIFSFVSILEATNNFSVQNKLGQGGFGPVYKGKLAEGKEIAVKRLSKSSGQGLVEFKNELILIAKLQHMNLVRLLGCCVHNEEKLLIYEYMPNKSLDSFLFDASKRSILNWRMRVMIIEGISQGLLYLHQHSRLRIIHRDLKVSNILLDGEMNPKISDFGMARIFKRSELIANTNNPVGTYGYMSPEYAMDGIFSVKSDIFSFGVIILEILSGRRNNSFYDTKKPLNLIGHAWDLWEKGAGLELMDPTLSNSCFNQQFLRLVQIGLLCVEESSIDRPTISEVISMITNESTILPMVKKPAFTNLDSNIHANPQRNDTENNSINNVSISTMNGR
ncbi:hypothetical protein QN277_014424 [Acacia crassicarpa]|uniref:Receptor-like serine/threonine-protein kinase n=1 Tax=Acacia crassicarpa TaxID=499986 RepID=A0AAE1JJP6_9FABA|nr:hypothetical protein QN277_014424 [Acacia crassicarpa]